ncbi:MAG: UDP-N-acetylmuramate dehydrogenase [Phycisphaerales bacterium JB064]
MPELVRLDVERRAALPTWFGVGGTADRLVRPACVEELQRCVRIDKDFKVLGEGANLLVADRGVRELVVSLKEMDAVSIDAQTGLVRAQAGADLMRLVQDTARAGLEGLHKLAGVPASIGGAVAMNAGGKYGSTFDHLIELTTMDRDGVVRTEPAYEFQAGYRDGGLGGRIVVEALFQLTKADPSAVREQVKAIMHEKKHSQPLAADSAGCVFKNPVLSYHVRGVGEAGERVSAGRLIDMAGCKGHTQGGASVSERHANFMVVDKSRARARDVIGLIDSVRQAVRGHFGIELETEVVIWGLS